MGSVVNEIISTREIVPFVQLIQGVDRFSVGTHVRGSRKAFLLIEPERIPTMTLSFNVGRIILLDIIVGRFSFMIERQPDYRRFGVVHEGKGAITIEIPYASIYLTDEKRFQLNSL